MLRLKWMILMVLPVCLLGQNEILNPGFEDWNSSNKAQHWHSTNITQLSMNNVQQTTDAHSGSYAVRGEVVAYLNAMANPGIFTGKDETPYENPFPVTQNYATFSGYYKFSRGDVNGPPVVLELEIGLRTSASDEVAEASLELQPVSSYTYFEATFVYNQPINLNAEVVHISIGIGSTPDGDQNLGSVFYLDDLSLNGVVSSLDSDHKQVPAEYSLKQNYPNPFNPNTTFEFKVPQKSSVSLKVFDINGKEIAQVLDGTFAAGVYRKNWHAENLASGIYIYHFTAGDFSKTGRMMLLK